MDTEQETVLLILRKQPVHNSDFTLNVKGYTIFSNRISELLPFYENSTSLSELGFEVNVGTVVWNQKKGILTADSTKTRLIYSSDIVNNQLVMTQYKDKDKKNYIDQKGISKPMIVLNRGYGKGAYKFNYCLLEPESGFNFLVENHLITIQHKTSKSKELYKKILVSFNDERTSQFVQMYFGNNAINTSELSSVLPIYI
jgi:hypothetical protein